MFCVSVPHNGNHTHNHTDATAQVYHTNEMMIFPPLTETVFLDLLSNKGQGKKIQKLCHALQKYFCTKTNIPCFDLKLQGKKAADDAKQITFQQVSSRTFFFLSNIPPCWKLIFFQK